MGYASITKSLALAAFASTIGSSILAAPSETPSVQIPKTILMDGNVLARNKQLILAREISLQPAYPALIRGAEITLKKEPISVVNKERVPPGASKHDYASYGRYWWPDTTRPDGLPYIQRDGHTNPESQDPAKSDRSRLNTMTRGVERLGLAYYFTGEQRYADKAAELLRVWFLNPETRMNPNMDYAQAVPGIAVGRSEGIMDSRLLCRALEGAIMIADSNAWSETDMKALRGWVAQLIDWLKSSDLAMSEARKKNNHGTYYDIQAIYFALFIGDTPFAARVAEDALEKRILAQIEPNGSQPEELARTRALHYSIFNLKAIFALAHMASRVDVELWHAGDHRIKAAMDYLAPYADPDLEWPYPDTLKAKRADLYPLLMQAAEIYGDASYLRLANKIPKKDREKKLGNLVYPLMP